MQVRFLEPASIELNEAFEYYEAQQAGLGTRFTSAVAAAVSRIQMFPDGYQFVGTYSRRCLVSGFPYGVIYQSRPEDNLILVVAISHLHRRPDHWYAREPDI